jgi:hypothetical protein
MASQEGLVQQEMADVKAKIEAAEKAQDREMLLLLRQELVELRKKENRLAEGEAGCM